MNIEENAIKVERVISSRPVSSSEAMSFLSRFLEAENEEIDDAQEFLAHEEVMGRLRSIHHSLSHSQGERSTTSLQSKTPTDDEQVVSQQTKTEKKRLKKERKAEKRAAKKAKKAAKKSAKKERKDKRKTQAKKSSS